MGKLFSALCAKLLGTTPVNPSAGEIKVYGKTGSHGLFLLDEMGAEWLMDATPLINGGTASSLYMAGGTDKRIRLRKDSLTSFVEANPFIGNGEVVLVADTGGAGVSHFRIGDGTNSFSDLPQFEATPTWFTAPGTATKLTASTFSVVVNRTNQDIFIRGRPLRYIQDGVYKYCIVTDSSNGTVVVVGNTLVPDTIQWQYGDLSRVVQVTFKVPGAFADSACTTLLASDSKEFFTWWSCPAFLVRWLARPAIDDSGASQPRVNVTIRGNVTSTKNNSAGLTVADAYWSSTYTEADMINNYIFMGDPVELTVDDNGTNKDAQDLNVVCLFILGPECFVAETGAWYGLQIVLANVTYINNAAAIAAMASSEIAMTLIKNSTSAITRLDQSTPITVPVMTSNTTPTGVAFASSEYDAASGAYLVFDNQSATRWSATAGATEGYVGYDFTNSVWVYRVELVCVSGSAVKDCKIQWSNNNTDWYDALSFTSLDTTSLQKFTVCYPVMARYWRLYVLNTHAGVPMLSRLSIYAK